MGKKLQRFLQLFYKGYSSAQAAYRNKKMLSASKGGGRHQLFSGSLTIFC